MSAPALWLVVALCAADPAAYRDADLPIAQWKRDANGPLLARSFALEQGPKFVTEAAAQKRIDEVVGEMKGNYGGTLVTAPPDSALDSPAFLSAYLRNFATVVDDDFRTYDYCFERILARIAGAPQMLADPRLDWDVWRAFLCYENAVAHKDEYNSYRGHDTIYNLDAAKDLLWMYLARHAVDIRKDDARRAWWLTALTHGMRPAGEPEHTWQLMGRRPLRSWLLLHLLATTDDVTDKTSATVPVWLEYFNQELKDHSGTPIRGPTPRDPFLIVERQSPFITPPQRLDAPEPPRPPFAAAIRDIARSQGLKYEVWGAKPSEMPPTKTAMRDLGTIRWQWAHYPVLGQESWSKESQWFHIGFFRPVGQRSPHVTVSFPTASEDGVFFFTHEAKLYVWPKAAMDHGAVQLLHRAKWLDDKQYAALQARGFHKLPTTLDAAE